MSMKMNIATGNSPAHTAHERSPLKIAMPQHTNAPSARTMRTKPIPIPKVGLAKGELTLFNKGRITAVKILRKSTHRTIAIPRLNPHQVRRVAGRSLNRFSEVFIILL